MTEFDAVVHELFVSAFVSLASAWVVVVVYAWWHIRKKPMPPNSVIGCQPDQWRRLEEKNDTPAANGRD